MPKAWYGIEAPVVIIQGVEKMPFVPVEQGKLYYDQQGKGKPLLLIHGAWASHRWWRWQVPVLSEIYQTIALDVRGHGQSTPLTGTYSVDGFTRDLDLFLHALGIGNPVLIGWSMGGIIAIQYCLNYPSKVGALVLIATRGHKNPAMKARIRRQYVRSVIDLLAKFSAPRKYDRSGASASIAHRKWLEKEARKMIAPMAPKEVYDWIVTELSDHPPKNFLEIAKSLWSWEAGDRLKDITTPTLIMVGRQDRFTPPRFSSLLHEKIPDSRLVIPENASHYLAMEYPEIVNAEIIKFLDGLGY